MPLIDDLLTRAVNGDNTAVKKLDLTAASADKKAQLASLTPQDFYSFAAGGGSDAGINTQSEFEQDVRTLNPAQLQVKWGDRADSIMRNMSGASNQVFRDRVMDRSAGETAGDLAIGVGTGLANSVGGLAALGAGVIDPRAGVAISEALGDLTEAAHGIQSDALQARRRAVGAVTALEKRDSQAQYESELEQGESAIGAGLRRIGRDVVSTIKNTASDPMMFSDGTAEAVGSLITAGPIGKGISAGANALTKLSGISRSGILVSNAINTAAGVSAPVTKAAASVLGNRTVNRAVDYLAEHGGTIAAIAGMEAGGTYAGSVRDVMEMKHDDLMKNSQEYRDLIGQGLSQEDAKIRLASSAGTTAAAIQAPLAALTGGIVAKFEANPLASPSLRTALGNVLLREPLEEGIQSATGQVSQNVGVRKADESRSLTEDVGEQIALGALYGFSSAGALQAPAIGARSAWQGTKATAKTTMWGLKKGFDATAPLREKLMERGEAIMRANEKASPVADEAVKTAGDAVATNAPTAQQEADASIDAMDIAPEAKDRAKQVYKNISDTYAFSDEHPDMAGFSEDQRNLLLGSQSRVDAAQRAAAAVNAAEPGSEAQARAMGTFSKLIEPIRDLQNMDGIMDVELDVDHPVTKQIMEMVAIANAVDQTPSVKRAQRVVNANADALAAQVKPISDEQAATPEGQQQAYTAVALSEAAPLNGNLEANETILKHAIEGRLNLTPTQRAILSVSNGLIRAARAATKAQEKLGLTPSEIVNRDIVSKEGTAGTKNSPHSALGFSTQVLKLIRSGQLEMAADTLEDFGKFVTHMNNKVAAYNSSAEQGGSIEVKYQQLQPGVERQFLESKQGQKAHLHSENSIKYGQQISVEADTLAQVYNSLVEAFPELSQKAITPVALNAALQGKAADVAASYRAGTLSLGKANTTPQKANVAPTPETPTTSQSTANQQTESSSNSVEDAKAISLNEGQKIAFTKILRFFENASQKTFTLMGAAGTGKTTLVNRIVSALRESKSEYGNIILTSPTHRANAVTRSKNPNEEVMTLHKLLGLSPSVNLENFDAKNVKFVEGDGNKFPTSGTIIVDESSMINQDLYEFLMRSAQGTDVKILFLGDPAQLKPVDKTNKNQEDSLALTASDDSYTLQKVERAKNPEMLSESVHIRESGSFSNMTNIKGNNGVRFYNDAGQFINKAINAFSSSSFKKNPLLVRIVAATNAAVTSWNKQVRAALYGAKPAPIEVGELLMGYSSFGEQDPDTGLTPVSNGVDYIVSNIGKEHTVTWVGVPVLIVPTTFKDTLGTGGAKTINIVSPNNSAETMSALSKAFANLNQQAFRERNPVLFAEEAGKYALMQDLKGTIETRVKSWETTLINKTLDYGYAHTIHKSQGGTYTFVFVDNNSINKFPSNDDRKRLKYVGLTRAESGAFVLTNDPITVAATTPTTQTQETTTTNAQPEPVKQEQTPVEPVQVEKEQSPEPIKKEIVPEQQEQEQFEREEIPSEVLEEVAEAVDTDTTIGDPKVTNAVDNDSAIQSVYIEHGLSEVGTFEQYKSYLDNLVVDSGIKKTLFHYSETGRLNKNLKLNQEEGSLFFYDDIINAHAWATGGNPKEPITTGRIFVVKVSVQESKIEKISPKIDPEWGPDIIDGFEIINLVKEANKNNPEAVIVTGVIDMGVEGTQYAINNTDNMTILGSKKDKANFNKWIQDNKVSESDASLTEDRPEIPTEVLEEVAETTDTDTIVGDLKADAAREELASREKPAPIEAKPEPKKEGIAAAFPSLYVPANGSNWFHNSFLMPEEMTSRLVGHDSPIQTIKNALRDSDSLRVFIDGPLKHLMTADIAKSYKDLMSNAEELSDTMKANLQKWLDADYSKKTPIKRGELFLSGSIITTGKGETFSGHDLNRLDTGKVLNIVEQVGDGFAYNDNLLQGAVLAGVQYMLTAGQREPVMDDDQIRSLTGIDPVFLSSEKIEEISQGFSVEDIARGISAKIRNYWGVRDNNNTPLGYVGGIPEAVALEVIRAMEEVGMIEKIVVDLPSELDDRNYKTINRFVFAKMTEESPLRAFPTAIEQAVMVSPEEATYIGDDTPPVSKTQMNNPDIQNTREQLEAQANEQATPFYPNMNVINFYSNLGADNLLTLFNKGNIENQVMNENHRKTVEGQNLTIASAYDQLLGLMAEYKNRTEAAKAELGTLPIRYAYNFSSVGRMQMLGKYNPQANKLMREAILPTWSTLDLSRPRGKGMRAFTLAMGQALGEKVHKQKFSKTQSNVEALLNGPLAPAVDSIKGWLSNDFSKEITSDDVNALKDVFAKANVELTPVALHALMEYARLDEMSIKDKAKFRTSLYLEADGVTNGPINAMVLMTAGKFTMDWLKNVAKGGLFFGSRKTMAEQQLTDSADMYETATQAAYAALRRVRKSMASSTEATKQMDHLLTLMSDLDLDITFDPDMNFDEEGALVMKRGIAKNPLTITIYGSGLTGIANKLTKIVTDAIYERMTNAAQAAEADSSLSIAEAMFPDAANPDAIYQRFLQSLDALTDNVAEPTRKGWVVSSRSTSALDPTNLVEFTFKKEHLNNIAENMLNLFVQPLRTGIAETVGTELSITTKAIQEATQYQSLMYEYMYNKEVEAVIAEKEKNDPTYRKGDFLSENELRAIRKKLANIAPIVRAPGQTFFIAGTKRVANAASPVYALDGTYGTYISSYAPSDAGVKGIPYLTIGMGDGYMMQTISLDKSITGTLKVFDGMNMPLDKIDSYSVEINKAVAESWKRNPVKAVRNSFDRGLFSMDSLEPGLVNVLGKAMRIENPTEANVIAYLNALGRHLEILSKEIDARHEAMTTIAYSVDHMAGAEQPYTTEDTKMIAASPLDKLNAEYEKALDGKLTQEEKNALNYVPASPDLQPAIAKLGTSHNTGVRLLGSKDVENLAKTVDMTEGQRTIYDEIRRSLVSKDYKVVIGTSEQIKNYQIETGKSVLSEEIAADVKGYVSIADKTIYLINPNVETLVHELIHAATFQTILDHYEGNTTPEISEAVKRIETMMQDFLAMDVASLPQEYQSAFLNAREAIDEAALNFSNSDAQAKAAALNEFMAWALTNEQISKTLKGTKVNKLVQLAKDVIAQIKKLIWGRKKAPLPADDVLTNLQFNTGIIIRSATVKDVAAEGMLFHSEAFGNDTRIARVRDSFGKKIIDKLKDDPFGSKDPKGELKSAPWILDAQRLSVDMAASVQASGFTMTPQESEAYQMVMTALATEAEIDPNALARAQELFSEVSNKLSPESFMPKDPIDPESARYYALEKYNVIIGKTLRRMDNQGRSTILSNFIALAMVNNEFREILNNIPVPKSVKNKAGTLDATLENLGNSMMNSLSARLSGENNAKNVRDALDNLAGHIYAQAMDEQSLIDNISEQGGNLADRVNEKLVEGIEATSDKLDLLGAKLKSTNTKAGEYAGNILKGIASIATEEKGNLVAESIVEHINKSDVAKPLHDFIVDLVGRTDNNAMIYDMIKKTRAMVQQIRQQFRDHTPEIIMNKFTRELKAHEHAAMFRGMGKVDLAVLAQDMKHDEIFKLFSDQNHLDTQINDLEVQIQNSDPNHWNQYQKKMQQLAEFTVTGKAGTNLLRNAKAISRLLNETRGKGWSVPDDTIVHAIDKLTTLYAIEKLPESDRKVMVSLVQSEAEGLGFTLDYLVGQRKEELRKATGPALYNAYKGYVPSTTTPGMELIVADDDRYSELAAQGFINVGAYNGSSIDLKKAKRSYYYRTVSGRVMFNQGIMQTVTHTANGVESSTGYTVGNTAGVIDDPAMLKKIIPHLKKDKGTETLLPVFNERGRIIALERSLNPIQIQRLQPSQHLPKMIGVWRGRQVEEKIAQSVNEELVNNMKAMYDRDIKDSASNQEQYVNLWDSDDPVVQDAVHLINDETRLYIRSVFGRDAFWVRKDMLRDAIGERNASIADMWTGNSRWSKSTQEQVRLMLIGFLGNEAYPIFVRGEQIVQNVVAEARNLIVVKSVVVPAINFLSNVYQLIARGVPLHRIVKGMPTKFSEIDAYTKTRLKQIELEAELRASSDDPLKERKILSQLRSITDSHKRMSIWPLIEAGEFSTIADVGMTAEDLELTSGKLYSYMEKQINKLPEGAKTLARYGLLTRDTPLFQALQKSVQYGDFIAKAVLYDDLTKRKKLTKTQALARISEEFVNYDRLPGRTRGYLENMGLLWFYNYKIQISKIGLSIIRNNPVHGLLALSLPHASPFGELGGPIEDNIVSKALQGTLGYSVGYDMAIRAPLLNPWTNIMS